MPALCPFEQNGCQMPVCVGNVCSVDYEPADTSCGFDGVCDGNGNCVLGDAGIIDKEAGVPPPP
jgi:hypothetical protein